MSDIKSKRADNAGDDLPPGLKPPERRELSPEQITFLRARNAAYDKLKKAVGLSDEELGLLGFARINKKGV